MNLDQIKGIAMRKMMTAMSATARDLEPMLEDSISSFYTGNPVVYERTGELMNSPKVTGPNGSGTSCSATMELDSSAMSHSGNFSEPQFLDATNDGTSGVVGTPGYWDRAEEHAKTIADFHFRKQFG